LFTRSPFFIERQMTAARGSATDRVEGTIERVTFHNPETGFAVLRIQPKRGDLITVVGPTPTAVPGEHLEAEGFWVFDPQHGPQLKATTIKTAPPLSRHGLTRYLASGSVKGVGPQLAEKIVEVFGDRTAEVLENTPSLLRDVPGIGAKRLAAIKDSWKEQKGVRALMLFLHGLGVSSTRAVRIHRTYGEQAIDLIRENPFRLAEDIRGIGFKTADEIAKKLGIPPNNPQRLRAALSYTLQQLTREGHVAYPADGVVEKTAALVESPVAEVGGLLRGEIERGRIVCERQPDGVDWLFPPPLFAAEVTIAAALRRLLNPRVHPFGSNTDWERTLGFVENQYSVQLADKQREAVRLATESAVSIVTGGPGVGKTTLVKCLLGMFVARGLQAVLCAPTGRAAKRLAETTGQQAQTIHRLLEFDPSSGSFLRNSDNPVRADLFVIDEASMLDVVLASQLFQAIPTGAAVVLVGDVDQLPSVGPGSVLQDVISSERVPTTRLTHIFRQGEGSWIVAAAHAILEGRIPAKQEESRLGDFYFIETKDAEAIQERLIELVRKRIPERFGFDALKDVQILAPMNRGALGARRINELIQSTLNPAKGKDELQRFGTTYRVGDRVLQTSNNYQKDVFNGDLGVVRKIDHVNQEMEVAFDGRGVPYDFGDLDELSLAYCLTIHKSQGSEYPCVVIPLHTQHFMMLQRNLLYTGVTRGKKLVVLLGSHEAVRIAVQRQDANRRFTALQRRIREPAVSRSTDAGPVRR
jgi:exodeoxyribonuclease V alpha subunit